MIVCIRIHIKNSQYANKLTTSSFPEWGVIGRANVHAGCPIPEKFGLQGPLSVPSAAVVDQVSVSTETAIAPVRSVAADHCVLEV